MSSSLSVGTIREPGIARSRPQHQNIRAAAMCAAALALCLTCACNTAGANRLWFERGNIVMPPIAGRQSFEFNVPAVPTDARPLLWIAARMEFVREGRLWPAVALELNGTPLGLDRIAVCPGTFTTPANNEWPPPDRPKCMAYMNKPRWLLRADDDDIAGNEPNNPLYRTSLYKIRGYLQNGVEPTYAIDLSGLIQRGSNTLVIDYAPVPDQELPPDIHETPKTPRPIWSLYVEFLRVGIVAEKEIAAYNFSHARTPADAPLAFNLLDPDGFDAMTAYYENISARAAHPEDRAYDRLALGSALRWKGKRTEAESNFRAACDADPRGQFAAQALFMVGVSRSEAGDANASSQIGLRLAAEFPSAAWTDILRREAVLVQGGIAELVGWPVVRAARASAAPALDGRVDDAAWQAAATADGFSLYPTKYRRFPLKTEMRLLYDDRFLYAAFVCHEPVMGEVMNPNVKRDSAVWYDDCVELFIDARRSYTSVCEFEVGVNGGIVDCLNVGDMSYMEYNPPVIAATARLADRWSVEIAIPWEAFPCGKPAAGEIWMLNAARNRPESANRRAMTGSLGPAAKRFAESSAALYLLFE